MGVGNILRGDDGIGSIIAKTFKDDDWLSLDCGVIPENYTSIIKNFRRELMRTKWGYLPIRRYTIFALFIFFFLPPDSMASRYHVKTTGTLISGPSTPNDWSDGNCYPAIHLACASAASEDSVLLFRETHDLAQGVDIPKFFGNQDLDDNYSDVKTVLASQGRVQVNGDFPRLMVRGISFEGNGESSNFAALEMKNISGLLELAFIQSCSFTNLQGSDIGSIILRAGGAAIRADGDWNNAYLEIRDCHFEDNVCRGSGGAVFLGDNLEIYISDTDFINNLNCY